jgi:hypothetical protein
MLDREVLTALITSRSLDLLNTLSILQAKSGLPGGD